MHNDNLSLLIPDHVFDFVSSLLVIPVGTRSTKFTLIFAALKRIGDQTKEDIALLLDAEARQLAARTEAEIALATEACAVRADEARMFAETFLNNAGDDDK